MVPVAPSNEPDRVAPVELNSEVPPVVTLAVACGVGELHSTLTPHTTARLLEGSAMVMLVVELEDGVMVR